MIGNRKLSPLVLVYLVAPVSCQTSSKYTSRSKQLIHISLLQLCFVMIAFLQPLMEGSAAYDDLPNVGVPILALSGGLAFALNVAGVYLIHSAGSLVLTLSGVLKVSQASGFGIEKGADHWQMINPSSRTLS